MKKIVFLVVEEFLHLRFLRYINILKKIDGWDVKKKENEIYFLEKNFTFKNFSESQKFVNEVGNIAESQGHHPDIIFGWGYAKIQIFTHKIK